MNVLEIPLTSRPQTFTIVLQSVRYTMRLWWLKPAQHWVIDVMDQAGEPILCGLPLVTGSDLLAQFQYLLPGTMFVLTDHVVPDEIPDFTHLGVTGHVYYRPPTA